MRLRRLEEEFGGQVELTWKSFLLRPHPQERSLEDFVNYTKSWSRPAADPGGGRFKVWESDEGPPSHSIPPHLISKAAKALGDSAFREVHDRLLDAYFWQSRDITSPRVLRAIWKEAGLPDESFPDPDADAEEILDVILAEHQEAIDVNVGGVPAVRRADQDVCVMGAQPIEVYRRWIQRLIDREI